MEAETHGCTVCAYGTPNAIGNRGRSPYYDGTFLQRLDREGGKFSFGEPWGRHRRNSGTKHVLQAYGMQPEGLLSGDPKRPQFLEGHFLLVLA